LFINKEILSNVKFNLSNVKENHLIIWFSISWIGHGITKDIPRSYQVQYRPCGYWRNNGNGIILFGRWTRPGFKRLIVNMYHVGTHGRRDARQCVSTVLLHDNNNLYQVIFLTMVCISVFNENPSATAFILSCFRNFEYQHDIKAVSGFKGCFLLVWM